MSARKHQNRCRDCASLGLQFSPIKALCNKLVITPLVPFGVSLAPDTFRANMVEVTSIPVPVGAKLFVYIDDLVVVMPASSNQGLPPN